MWAGSASAVPYVGVEAWLTASRDGTLRPVLGWYAVCDEHGTCDPSTHGTEAAARRWRCPFIRHPTWPGILHRDDKWKDGA